MAMEIRPKGFDYGSVLSAALFGAFPMLEAGLSDHTLWHNNYFLGGFIGVAFMSIVGLGTLFWHWRWRVIPPLLVLAAYGLVTFSAPSWGVLLALAVAAIVTVYFVSPDREKRSIVEPVSTKELTDARGERDTAMVRVTELEAKAESRYPDFHAEIYDILNQDPVLGPDMFVALVVEVLNNGHKSSAKAYKVSAKTTYGAVIKVEVLGNAFRLMVNGGRDCFDFLPAHYIMNRTYPKAVERGESVTGILPCVFRGIKNAKEVNTDTLKVEFIDVIGDSQGNGKWWSTNPVLGVIWEDPIPVKHRPTLPALQQPCGAQAVAGGTPTGFSLITTSQEEFVQELAPVAALFRETKALEMKVQMFLNNMEEEMPHPGKTAITNVVEEFVNLIDWSRERYDEELKPELIILASRLRNPYGIMPVGLTDEAILNESILPATVTPIKEGLHDAGDSLFDILGRKASAL
jgi:hypothetical protein